MWDVLGFLGILGATLVFGGWIATKLMNADSLINEFIAGEDVNREADDADEDDFDPDEWDRETWWLVDDSDPKWSGT